MMTESQDCTFWTVGGSCGLYLQGLITSDHQILYLHQCAL